MTFQAKYDNVIVKLIAEEAVTGGGIVLATTATKTHHSGEVKFVGPGRTSKDGVLIPVDVKVGDVVMFGLQSGIKITVDEQDLVVLKADDIFAVEE